MSDPDIVRVGRALTLDRNTFKARRRGFRPATLNPTQAGLLAMLMRDPSRVFSREEIFAELFISTATLETYICTLRRALGKNVIRTVHGHGYQLGVAKPAGRATQAAEPWLQAGELRLQEIERRVRRRDRRFGLSLTETRLLACLIRRVGRIATHEELMTAGRLDPSKFEAYLKQMSELRGKLRRVGADHLLVAVDGGYRLACDAGGVWRIAELEFEPATSAARLRGRPLELWPVWIALLERLAVAPGQPVSSAELIAHAWGARRRLEPLEDVIAKLQAALGPIGSELIVAAGDGYRLAIERFGLLAVGPMLLDPASCCVRIRDREQQLAPSESRLLEQLMRDPGVGFSREVLCAASGLPTRYAFKQCLAKLRAKLRRLDLSLGETDLIVTVPGPRYMLAADRIDTDPSEWPLRLANLRFRPSTREVRAERPGTLGPNAALMLEQLMRAAGEIVPDETLFESVWGEAPPPTALKGCMQRLRQALDEIGAAVVVKCVRGSGYRLLATDD